MEMENADDQKAKKPLRYTLVEAEEDDGNEAGNNNVADTGSDDSNQKGKKGTTWRKLSIGDAFSSNRRGGRGGRGARGGRRVGGGRGRGGGGRSGRRGPRLFISKHANQNANALFTPENQAYYPMMAASQVEFYFSPDNLCRDTFLRSYMDEEGYVPIAFICNFPAVACFGAGLNDIIDCLRNSETLEIDDENETIRLKESWQVWLFPNPQGGRGVPRWVKAPEQPEDESADQQDALKDDKGEEEQPAGAQTQETAAGQSTDSGDQIKAKDSEGNGLESAVSQLEI